MANLPARLTWLHPLDNLFAPYQLDPSGAKPSTQLLASGEAGTAKSMA